MQKQLVKLTILLLVLIGVYFFVLRSVLVKRCYNSTHDRWGTIFMIVVGLLSNIVLKVRGYNLDTRD
jgi:hypothetical protein